MGDLDPTLECLPAFWTAKVPLLLRHQDRSNSVIATTSLHIRKDPRKVLELVITQDADPFFLYSLSLTDDDYHILKSEQGLVVDFNVFPDKVIELLSGCMETVHKK
jgi:hypothetical protein